MIIVKNFRYKLVIYVGSAILRWFKFSNKVMFDKRYLASAQQYECS